MELNRYEIGEYKLSLYILAIFFLEETIFFARGLRNLKLML